MVNLKRGESDLLSLHMKTRDLSKGNPALSLILFALPMILSVTLQQIYNIADGAIAGRFISSDALAAVSASYPITMVYLAFATGIGVGSGVITSKYFGAKDFKNTKSAIYTSLIFTTLFACFMIVLTISLSDVFLRLINTPINIFDDSLLYLKFYSGGLLFTYLYNVVTSIFQSLGNSKTPLYFLLFSTILNIILDLIFVCLLKLEVLGLALGTFIAQGIAMIFSLSFLLISIRKSLKTAEKISFFNVSILKSILMIAIPSIIQGSAISIGNFFIQSNINSYGSDLIAGYGAAFKLCYVVVNIFTAYSNAISNYTAQNIGANTHKRIISGFKASLLICIIFSFVSSLIFILIPEVLLKVFMDDTASINAINYGKDFIVVVAPFFFLMALKIPSDGVLKGSKDMLAFMTGTIIDLAIRIAICFILPNYIGYIGIFWGWPIGWAFGAIISLIFFFSPRWKRLANFNTSLNN